jgi:hypothetical protein
MHKNKKHISIFFLNKEFLYFFNFEEKIYFLYRVSILQCKSITLILNEMIGKTCKRPINNSKMVPIFLF